uniref:Uncharacterized protein n=1 Tax=Meloidogyne enterolobii TaxID=390850 RepID=A0A6V7Y9D6_MELEN|nr:unnamed protein product [Meloidogyne enterolobii]
MSNSFYVCLLSNVPDYTDNQPNKFRVHLPKPLYFSGDWVCGVHSISYPYSWSSTIGTLDEQWIDINFTDNNKKGQTIRVPVPKGSHNTPEEILQFLISTLRYQSSALDNTTLEESSEGFFDKPTIINRRNKRQHEELQDLTPYNENEEENESLRSLSPYQEDVEETSPPQKDKINLTKQPEKEKVEEQKKVNEKKKEEDQKKEEEKKKEQPREEPKKEVDQKKLEEKVEEKKRMIRWEKSSQSWKRKRRILRKKCQKRKRRMSSQERSLKRARNGKRKKKSQKWRKRKRIRSSQWRNRKRSYQRKSFECSRSRKEGRRETERLVCSKCNRIGESEEENEERTKEVLRELSPYKEEEPLPPPPKKERKEDNSTKDNSTQTPSVLSALGLERKESWTQTPSPLLETIGLKPKEGKKDVFDILLGKGKTPYTSTLLKQIIDSISINYLADFKRFKLSFTHSSIKYVSFSPQLGYVLGFANSQHVQNNEIAKYAYDLRGGFSSFAIYAKGLTENMIVGNSLSSLLRIVSVSGAIPGEYHEKIYDSPIYVRVLPREVNEIEVELRTMDNGRLVPFAYGTVSIVLIFKKVINF